MSLPEFIIGNNGDDSEPDYIVRLHRPRFVARIQPADEPRDVDWFWIVEGIECLSIVEWIDTRPADPSPLLRAAAAHVEIATLDAFDQEEGE